MEKITRIKLSELVIDYTIYPRHKVDDYHVRSMVESLRSGSGLPPMLVEKKSRRVIDGVHRYHAYQRVNGPDFSAPCILKEWPDEKSLVIEAIALNSAHGRSLTTFDKARCVALAETWGIEPVALATALKIRVERLEILKATRLAFHGQESVALKATVGHLAGKELSDNEFSFIPRAGGPPQAFYINQVIALLENNVVDWENERVAGALRKLMGLLEKALLARV